ncbi:hypothetical protein SLEP1_g46871 [Rubroshorea leprosula]|uniref:Uncharacterized protein n=1 Tax=Rubroshorea leprosula TaxID=152421 RepID=A0AAV5LRC2_9ROSI|nr:hypothetical protein SLEP1_g46871 [Rubroshorea leprosula]
MGSYLATIQTISVLFLLLKIDSEGHLIQAVLLVHPWLESCFVVIGAGGAGKALVYGTEKKGARVVIANWTYEPDQLERNEGKWRGDLTN